MTNSKDRNFIIVGASLAGAQAVRTLREEGFDGRIPTSRPGVGVMLTIMTFPV